MKKRVMGRIVGMFAFLVLLLTSMSAMAGDYLLQVKLSEEEGKGGHALERHVNVDNAFLYDRLKKDGTIDSASRYKDKGSADKAVNETLKKNENQIKQFVTKKARTTSSTLTLEGSGDGYTLTRAKFTELGDNPKPEDIDKAVVPCNKVVVVVRPKENMAKNDPDWKKKLFVLTSYPKCD